MNEFFVVVLYSFFFVSHGNCLLRKGNAYVSSTDGHVLIETSQRFAALSPNPFVHARLVRIHLALFRDRSGRIRIARLHMLVSILHRHDHVRLDLFRVLHGVVDDPVLNGPSEEVELWLATQAKEESSKTSTRYGRHTADPPRGFQEERIFFVTYLSHCRHQPVIPDFEHDAVPTFERVEPPFAVSPQLSLVARWKIKMKSGRRCGACERLPSESARHSMVRKLT